MTRKTKTILKHLGVMLLCLLLAAGCALLGLYLFGKNPSSASDKDDTMKFFGTLVFFASATFVLGFFLHLCMVFSNARVHCKNCGELAYLQNYKVLKQNVASDGVHVTTEVIQMNMRCRDCKKEFQLKKRFRVSSYNAKHHVWKVVDVDRAVGDYARGQLWF